MCGLVGVAGDLNGTHDRILKTLLTLDALRGEDSAGVAFVNKFSASVSIAKALGDPYVLFSDGKYAKGVGGTNKVMLGHNRYATSGGVAKASAHPFEFDTLVGAHNGTINSRFRLDDERDFKVDSQALYHNIEINGLKETIGRLGAQGNAWSLTWWNKEEQTLNFLRNKERPMHMCRSKDSKVLFWASEAWMLEVALAHSKFPIDHGPIFETEVDMHYSVHIDNKGDMHKPKIVKVEALPIQIQVHPQQRGRPGYIPNKTTQTAPVVNNVVQLPVVAPAVAQTKKLSSSGNNNGLASEASYLKAKERKFELLCERVDGNGGRYLALFDPKEPCVDLRLYPLKQDSDLFDMCGEDITGDIGSYDIKDKSALRGYYKVSPWSVKRVLPVIPSDDPTFRFLIEDEEEEGPTVMDHNGRLVTPTEWKKHYSVCGWCDSPLDPHDRNRYTTSGDCLCPGCATNREVTQYVNIV